MKGSGATPETLFFRDNNEWEAWLAENHDTPQGIWMLYYRVSTGREGLGYREALETALRYGWIDSTLRKVDEERYVRRFTPRRRNSRWSPTNLRAAERLISEGRMTERGMKALGEARERPPSPETAITEKDIDLLFQNDEVTHAAFDDLPASQRRQYARYVLSGKSQGTRDRRMMKVAPMIREGRPPLL